MIPSVVFEVLRPEPEVEENAVRFVQTVGGRAGFPAPRTTTGGQFFRIHSANAWTTLALTIRTDGSSEHQLVGASTFPRHWIYDRDGNLVAKSGTIDFKAWYRGAQGERTPWGDEDSDAFVTAAESALEREISGELMAGNAIPERRALEPGETLVEQGAPGDELYLVLDGVLAVGINGDEVAEIGPGAIVGERALLEGGTRTATLSARTRCRVAVIPGELIDRRELEDLSAKRRA
jgi:cyclic nucleotide-binding protein